MKDHQPHILVPINRGHMARLLVYSGVVTRLAEEGALVTILTPGGSASPLRQFLPESVTCAGLPLPRARLADRWNKIYFYFFQASVPTRSSRARLEAMKTKQSLRHRIITGCPPLLLRGFRRTLTAARRAILPEKSYRQVFAEHKPDLVVAGSLGRNLEDYYLLRYANRHGIRTLGTIQSWDTLTTKEYGLERPQRLTVWNPANQREAVELFGYPAADVAVVGAPQFDIYRKRETFCSRDQWLERQGFSDDRHTLFVTGQGGHVHHNLTEVIEALAFGIEHDLFIKPVQILVRPHPAVYFGAIAGQGTEEDLVSFEALSPYIKANRPIRSVIPIVADAAASEYAILANNLFHSAALIDFYGTLAVEACIMDRPVIYAHVKSSFAAGSNGQSAPYEGIDYSQYEHIRYILGMQGTRTAFSRQQLFDLINYYIQDPTCDRAGRKQIAEAFCSRIDGRSAERMARVLFDYASGQWPAGLV